MRRGLTTIVGGAAVVAWLIASPAAYAQHHGGGGGHMGGYGGHMGGYGGHYGGYGGHYGGYGGHYGGNYGYGRYGGYGYGYGYPYGLGLYLGLGGLGYSYYPGYDSGYYGGYANAPGVYAPPAVIAPDASYGVQTQSGYTPSAGTAEIVVRLPANARLWVDDYQSQQTGRVRVLRTPADLQPGQTYHYTLKAEWDQDGKPVTQERNVDFTAGQTTTVDFNQPAT